jgi:hypothetical protein
MADIERLQLHAAVEDARQTTRANGLSKELQRTESTHPLDPLDFTIDFTSDPVPSEEGRAAQSKSPQALARVSNDYACP